MDSQVGAIAPDGSPVEVYLRLPPGDEPEIIHAAVAIGSDILELGCGTGRMTHRLVELGHRVTAVDESREMLSHVRDAESVLASIEELDLGRRFGCVVLASHLINHPDRDRRKAFLQTCRRHVADDGCVLIERYEPDFDWRAIEGKATELGEVTCTLRDVSLDGSHLAATMEYEIRSWVWKQPFEAALLSDEELEHEVGAAAPRTDRWLDTRRSWLRAESFPPSSIV